MIYHAPHFVTSENLKRQPELKPSCRAGKLGPEIPKFDGLRRCFGILQVFGVSRKAVHELSSVSYKNYAATVSLTHPFVCVPTEAVGKLNSGKLASVSFRQQRRGSVCTVNVHPHIVFVTYVRYFVKGINASRIGGTCACDNGKGFLAVFYVFFHLAQKLRGIHAETAVGADNMYLIV